MTRPVLLSDQLALRAAVEAIDPVAYWRECAGCGRELEPAADDTHCPSCAVDRLLYDGMDE